MSDQPPVRSAEPGAGSDPPTGAPELPLVVEPVRVIDPAGQPTGTWPAPELDAAALVGLYRHLVVTRALDDEMVRLQRQGQLSTYPPCRGQEAAQIGTAAALRSDDWLFPSYRELGCAVVRGVPPAALGHAWRGTWYSDYDVRAHCFAPLSVPVGTSALHAVGFALGARLAEEPVVAAAYFGEGAASEGDVHEALNFASVFRVPAVFVIQNNGWAISTPTWREFAGPTLAHRAPGYGMAAWRCDGNDVLASYAVMAEAAAWARAGNGPALIEALTYRMGPHTTSDDPTRYRTDDEVAHWAALDPISRYRAYLLDRAVIGPELITAVDQEAAAAADRLRLDIFDAPAPSPLEVFDHVYADPPAALLEQRRQLAAELAAWADAGDAPIAGPTVVRSGGGDNAGR